MAQLLESPLRAGAGIVGTTAASPAMSRLDRILELITDHEANYRDQDIKLSQVTQKMTELEMRMQQEMDAIWRLKERNIPQELDLARTAVETVVRQLATVTRTNQMLQSELKSCQQKQQQQQAAYESTIAVLQSDMEALRNRLSDTQDNTRAAVEQLQTSFRLQLDKQRHELEEQYQSQQQETRSAINALQQGNKSQSTAAVRELETWSKSEMLQLAGKVKAVVAGCANHQQQINLQMEALQLQWENSSSTMEALQSEDKRIKKHVVRLQHQMEELQRLSQQAVTSEVVLQQIRNDMQSISAQQQQLTTRLEVTCGLNSSLSQKVSAADQQLAAINSKLANTAADLAKLAESVGNCLAAARAEAAAAAAPSSYLSTLLAPVEAGSGGGAAAGRKAAATAWDHHLAEFQDCVGRLRRNSVEQHLSGSPNRYLRAATAPGASSSSYISQQRLASPARSSSGAVRRL